MIMLPAPAELLTAFMIGLLGSGHCIAMCGGIAGALAMRAGGNSGATLASAAIATPLYSLGRIGSYALLGAVAGTLGAVATELIPATLLLLRTLAGVLLVLMGVYLAGLWNGLLVIERAGAGLFGRLRPLAAGVRGPLEPLALGAVWGLLPCGLVYGALAWSLTHADPLKGAVLMFCFGLGTLPAVLIAGFAGLPLGRALRRPLLRRSAGALLVAFGIWTLAMAGGHGGHNSSQNGGHGGHDSGHEVHGSEQHGGHISIRNSSRGSGPAGGQDSDIPLDRSARQGVRPGQPEAVVASHRIQRGDAGEAYSVLQRRGSPPGRAASCS